MFVNASRVDLCSKTGAEVSFGGREGQDLSASRCPARDKTETDRTQDTSGRSHATSGSALEFRPHYPAVLGDRPRRHRRTPPSCQGQHRHAADHLHGTRGNLPHNLPILPPRKINLCSEPSECYHRDSEDVCGCLERDRCVMATVRYITGGIDATDDVTHSNWLGYSQPLDLVPPGDHGGIAVLR